MTTPEEREEARGIYVECERLRAEKGLSKIGVSAAAGMSPAAYSNNINKSARGRSICEARKWLAVIENYVPNGTPPTRKTRENILAPTDPTEHLRRCLTLDLSRLLFIRAQGDEVERRIEQTRAALACFDAEGDEG